MEEPSVSLILPAYNEVRAIAGTITEAQTFFEGRGTSYEIIVSAEGDDGTRELVTELATTNPNVKVVGAVERRGKGYRIREGVTVAQGSIVGYADADNKTPISEFAKVYPLLADGWDVVIGSRKIPGARIERPPRFYRRIASGAFPFLVHALLGLRDIPDTQCGFKFFQRGVALDIFRRQRIDGYMVDVEILYLARRAGYRIAQVPVRWRDDNDSRLRFVSGNISNLREILSIRFGEGVSRRPGEAPAAITGPSAHS